jgi:hypothetical protein
MSDIQRHRCVLVEEWNDGKHYAYAEMHADDSGPWVTEADHRAAVAEAKRSGIALVFQARPGHDPMDDRHALTCAECYAMRKAHDNIYEQGKRDALAGKIVFTQDEWRDELARNQQVGLLAAAQRAGRACEKFGLSAKMEAVIIAAIKGES